MIAALALAGAACEELPPVAPLADFVFTPVSPIYAGQTAVVFNGGLSVAATGSIRSYSWDFGDGTAPAASASSSVTHVFPAGICVETTYAVLLTITDERDQRASASNPVRVLPAPGACPSPAR
jgi:hypothetical protein